MMYQKLPNLVIGFHGCTKKVFDAVVLRGDQMKSSNNEYDWLGNGIYFGNKAINVPKNGLNKIAKAKNQPLLAL